MLTGRGAVGEETRFMRRGKKKERQHLFGVLGEGPPIEGRSHFLRAGGGSTVVLVRMRGEQRGGEKVSRDMEPFFPGGKRGEALTKCRQGEGTQKSCLLRVRGPGEGRRDLLPRPKKKVVEKGKNTKEGALAGNRGKGPRAHRRDGEGGSITGIVISDRGGSKKRGLSRGVVRDLYELEYPFSGGGNQREEDRFVGKVLGESFSKRAGGGLRGGENAQKGADKGKGPTNRKKGQGREGC